MTEVTNVPMQDEILPKRRVQFYRDKRCFRSLLVAFCVLVLTAHTFMTFVSYVLSGLFLDWLFFTYDGCKDSEQAPESYFLSRGITPQQMDEFNEFMIKVRRASFAASISVTTACLLFFQDFSYQAVFVITYIGINFGTMLIASSKKIIIWPYHYEDHVEGDTGIVVGRLRHYDPNSESALVNPFFGTVVKPRNHFD